MAPPALQTGAALGTRLRLEEGLPFLPDGRLWRAVDLHTRAVHAVEVLGPISGRSVPSLLSRRNALSLAHPHLQPFYRYEEIDGLLYSVSGYDDRLATPPSFQAADDRWQNVAVTKSWLRTLFEAVRVLHQRGLPAHGAIVPSRIAGNSTSLPLLTGYPYAQGDLSTSDRAFLSPQHRRAQPPEHADDVYSLAALAFWLFSLGKEPKPEATVPELIGQMDAARREKGVAPLAWPEGAEFALLSGLQEDRAKRPPNAVEFLVNLEPFLLPDKNPSVTSASATTSAIAARSFIARAPAPWRRQQLRRRQERLSRLAGDNHAAISSETPVELLPQLKTLQAELQRLENDLIRRETLLAGEREAFSAQKATLLERDKEVQRDANAAADQRAQIKQARERLEQQQEEQRSRERELDGVRDALRREEETQVSTRNAVQQEKNRLIAEKEQLQRRSDQLTTRQTELAAMEAQTTQTERALSDQREGLSHREQALGLVQQELTKISGTSDVRQWDFFVQQLRATKADLERRTAAMAKREIEEASGRGAALLAANATLDSADSKTSIKPEADPSRASPPVLSGTASPPPVESVLAPERALTVRATIGFSNNRRLHLFGGPHLRFGRHGDSDVLLVALQNGVVQTTGVNREISRKHFELKVDGARVNLIDGWSDDGRPSQHGLCVDGKRVAVGGVLLRPGMLISVTTRLTGGAVPHWKVNFLSSSDGLPDVGAKKELGAIFLKRLDDAPDDILMILSKAALSAVGGAGLIPEGTLLVKQGGSFIWKVGEADEELLAVGPSRFPGVTVLSVGWCSPTVALAQS